ncbi:MAG: extracellular solute-binding protein [Clostridia bacterium]|nr:extracellular solute-binding protein [Clostridia bacterium]
MRKLVSLLLAGAMCASMAFGVVGCHKPKYIPKFDVPEEFDETNKYEITFWAKNDTNATQKAIYEDAISSFEALYPNIKVNIRFYTDYSAMYNDVITNISTNTTPNVCITYPDHIATYMTGENIVVPLDDLMMDSKYGLGGSELKFDSPTEDEMVSEFMEECVIGDSHYAIPYMRSTEACYINKDMVEALGYELPEVLTWDFVWEVSEAAMEKNSDGSFKINNQMTMIPFIYKSTDNMMIQSLAQKGAGYSTPSGKIEIFNDTTASLLKEFAAHGKSGAFSTFKISSYPGNFLNAGQCIFAIDSTAGATWMGTNAPNLDISSDKLVDFETVVYPIPQYDPEHPKMISQGPSICIFNKEDTMEVLASWLFASYLLTNDVQISYSQTEGYVPVTKKAQESAEYQDYLSRAGEDNELYYDIKIEAAKMLIANTENTFVTPVFNGSASLRMASGELIENAVKSARRKKAVDDEFIAGLYEDVTSLYRLDQIVEAEGEEDPTLPKLGKLPGTSKALLITLGATWVLIGCYVGVDTLKKKKK